MKINKIKDYPFPGEPCPVNRSPCSVFRPPFPVYFLGIGGIGMSALARYYKHAGAQVAGYDRTPSPLTAELECEGIGIHYEDDVTLIPPAFTASPEKTLVIYTPALPAGHRELNYFKENNYTLIKRSKALGHIAAEKTTLAVAGTHGKSTITTLLAHLLTQAGEGCTAFLGGISKNYHTNLLLSDSPALVAEADEFDRSFLQLFPQIAIITATDADHLDIYGTAGAMKQAFAEFAQQVQPGGALILKLGIDLPMPSAPFTVYRYSLDRACDFYASNIRQTDNGLSRFDLHLLGTVVPDCTVGVPGWMNIENAVAAAAAAYLWRTERGLTKHGQYCVSPNPVQSLPADPFSVPREPFPVSRSPLSALRAALASFSGVQRRFDVQFNTPQRTYIDDYAHHPEELRAAITSLREVFPQRKITGIFQPHLYTRTRDFAGGFAESLSLLDELILLDIYPARETPIAGVSSQMIFDKVTIPHKQLCTKSELMDILKTKSPEVLVTFGAGDIDRFVQPIKEWLEHGKRGTEHGKQAGNAAKGSGRR
ncbi:MAG: UDP-N-acetylmuramate--L-alanine ligase [Prevotellaceae bacterium]|jgi:UDP-N-acetylmuramate--alanine ligase|nr:UDP-N-acetylmuramate--L-alanine ligase [Prevotellaceae bacterium]